MKKKLSILLGAMSVIAVFAFQPAASLAACNDGDSRARDYTGEPNQYNQDGTENPAYNPNYGKPTGEDTLGTTPGTNSTVYGDDGGQTLDPGYLGVTGSAGYIEVSGNADNDPNIQVDGAESGGRLDGRAGVDTGGGGPDACVNGTEVL